MLKKFTLEDYNHFSIKQYGKPLKELDFSEFMLLKSF